MSDDFLVRLRAEAEELGVRIAKLRAFIGGDGFAGVSESQRYWLQRQYDAMREYARCLRFRLEDLSPGGEVTDTMSVDAGGVGESWRAKRHPVLDDSLSLAQAGLEGRTFGNLDRAGYRLVGDVRRDYAMQVASGGGLTDLPGIGDATATEVEAKLLNDRDYSASEV